MRVAVICDPEIVEGDQVVAHLTERGFSLLERADLPLIIRENRLARGMLTGELASAGAVVLIERIEVESDEYLATRLIVREDGRIHASDLRPRDEGGRAWFEIIERHLRDVRRSLEDVDEGGVKVSVQAIREEYEAGRHENPLVGRALVGMVEAGLAQQRQIKVLERHDLGLVQFERVLTRVDDASFEGAERIVTATFKSEGGATRILVQVSDKRRESVREEEISVPSEAYPEIAEAIVERAYSLIMEGSNPPDPTIRPGTASGAREAEQFAEEAERAVSLGLHEHARAFAETAFLLNDDDSGSNLYLLATTELLAAIPGLRGRGLSVERGFGMQFGPSGAPEKMDLLTEMVHGRDHDEFPLPDEKQWATLALAAERYSDLEGRALRDNGTLDGTKALVLRGSLMPLLKEAALNCFARHGGQVPNYEREMLERIAAAIWRPADGPTTPVERFFDESIRYAHEILLFESSRDAAIETLRHWFYGPHLAGMREKSGREAAELFERVESLRRACFGVLEYEGFDPENGDRSSAGIDDRIAGKPFVAWLSGSGIPFKEAVEEAVATAPEQYHALARCDALWADAASRKRGTERDVAISRYRAAIRENFVPLQETGLLEFYLEAFQSLERSRYSGEDDLGEFWREAHMAVYAGDRISTGHITEVLIGYFNGERWGKVADENSASFLKLLESMEADLTGNRNPSIEHIRKTHLAKIAEAKQLVERGDAARALNDPYSVGTLLDVPPADTFAVQSALFGYDLPTLATFVGEDGIYLFQHGNSYRGHSSRILRFFPARSTEHIQVPDEVRDLVERSADVDSIRQVQRIGAMVVGVDRISLAFPGGVAEYNRTAKTWKVTPVPFLESRKGMTYVGDSLVSFVGSPPMPLGPVSQAYYIAAAGGSQGIQIGGGVVHQVQGPPVSGLYVTSPGSQKHHAVADTSRVPARNPFDGAGLLRFSFRPIEIPGGRFLIGMAAADAPQAVYEVDAAPPVDGSPRTPVTLPFDPGPGASLGGTRANGYSLVTSVKRRPVQSGLPEGDWRLDIGAFAVGPDGTYEWLLDTGTPREANPANVPRVVPIFTNAEKPRHAFPARFAMHRGIYNPAPVLLYDGTRLLMLTGQLTIDGRRLLYVWEGPDATEPVRIGLRFDSFRKIGDPELSEDERLKWNREGRNEIFSMVAWKGLLLLEYRRGFFSMKMEDLMHAIRR